MTLEEKLGCLDGDTPFWPGLTDMSGGGGYYLHPWPAAVVERLGIPGIEFADGPRGCVIGDATAFPVSMARGATFDPDLEERIGEAIGAELRASGATFTGAVCMNLLRHPAWGRAQETYGEDPHHVGVMAAALTRGLQRHVMACMKHFALNSMENARFTVDVTVGERALHEVYLPHFERVGRRGRRLGDECVQLGERRVVRSERDAPDRHPPRGVGLGRIRRSPTSSSACVMPSNRSVPGSTSRCRSASSAQLALGDAIARGDLDVDVVDRAVGRIVATLLRFAPQIAARPPLEIVGCDAHRTLGLRHRGALGGPPAQRGRPAPDRSLDDRTGGRARPARRPAQSRRRWFERRPVVVGRHRAWTASGPRSVTIGSSTTTTDASIAEGADLAVVVVGYTKDDEGEYMGASDMAQLSAELFPPIDHPELGAGAPMEPFAPTGRAHPAPAPAAG